MACTAWCGPCWLGTTPRPKIGGRSTPSSAVSQTVKRLLLLAAIAVLALGLAGFITGAIGAAFLGKGKGFLPVPGVHLPPQVVVGEHPGASVHGNAFSLTNTMLSSFITTGLLILLFVLGTARMRLVPRGVQNFVEVLVEGLLGFVEGVVGKERGRKLLPVIATIFLFVAFNAWMGLLPLYQSLGFLHDGKLEAALLRPAGTDLNMPLALALISFVFVEGLGLREFGLRYFGKFFRFGDLLRGRLLMGLIQVFVGFLELTSELVRVVSFTFRLFGNMTAGELLLLVSAFLVTFVFTIPFYGLEILVGFVQALIFAGLTLVFAAVALTPHEEEHQ
ncbi:MAG: F0F1 ATP synthase subunit A [Chloroflexi bacterium]|nr:F0F1 ATP synthase subunit A [Chloroflexota bacterium]